MSRLALLYPVARIVVPDRVSMLLRLDSKRILLDLRGEFVEKSCPLFLVGVVDVYPCNNVHVFCVKREQGAV